jgi:hypothetical protein
MPRVGDDSGTQILPGLRKDSEHQAVHADDDRGFCTLINVARAKQRRREKHADRSAAGPGDKLPLQVAAKNGFFAHAGGNGEGDPEERFERALWSKKARGLAHSIGADDVSHETEDKESGDPKAESNSDIDKKIGGALPTLAGDVSNGFSTAAQAPVNLSNENPFPGHRGDIKKQAMGLVHSALAMDGEISDNRNHGKDEKKEQRVHRTGYFLKPLNRRF